MSELYSVFFDFFMALLIGFSLGLSVANWRRIVKLEDQEE